MHIDFLDLLRCPFCGTRLSIVDNSALVRTADEIRFGVLGCECCAFPILDGIPVLVADDTTRDAMHQLEAGDQKGALVTILQLEGDRIDAFLRFLARGDEATYREGLRILSVDAEGEYFIYRFSDPTFVVAQAIVRALGKHRRLTRRTIDLCGGSGHLTRVLASVSDTAPVLADLFFWKLWLAKHFTSPGCEPVCCDANAPLPFSRQRFSMVMCSDAFPYIWHKRLLADEMMRLTTADGVIVMPHLHSALGENFTAGMTLTPQAYQDLFEPCQPRLFRDSALLDEWLEAGTVDLGAHVEPSALAGEPAVALIASREADVFRAYAAGDVRPPEGQVVVNPLYRIERGDEESILTLTFPTPEYEEEFAAAKRYLPAIVTVHGDLSQPLSPASIGKDYEELRRRLVLIDAPNRYV